MKTEADAHDSDENEYGSAKYENETKRPRYRRKMSQDAQKMKTGPDALGTAKNEFRSAKHEIET
jgi:hypothetical protein